MKALFDPLVPRKVTLASAQTLLESSKVMAELQKARAPLEKELEALAPFSDNGSTTNALRCYPLMCVP